MTDPVQRAEIQRYVEKAFLTKIMRMNETRETKLRELAASLAARGQGPDSSAWMIGEVDVEEDCISELLHQKAALYIEAYKRKNLQIGHDVLKDISESYTQLAGTRKSVLVGQAELTSIRTNRPRNMMVFSHLGRKASVSIKEIEAEIDLYNLTPVRSETTQATSGVYPIEQSKGLRTDDQAVSVDAITRLKQNSWIGYLLAAFATIAGIATFTDSVTKISDNLPKLFGGLARTKTVKLAFDSGWIFAGYYDPSTQTFTQVPYVEIDRTSYSNKQKMPRVGDCVRVTGERNVIIAGYATSGTTEQMNPPLHDLAASDYTGVKLPSGTVMEVRDVGGGSYEGRPAALWLRVAGISQ